MAKQPRSLAGKVAVVTGGGRGIGKAISRSLAREGVRVAIADLDGAVAEEAAAEAGGGAIGLALDVTDRPAFTAALDDVEQRLGPIDVIVNNAGIMPIGPFEEETDATAIRQLELNLHAVIHGSKEAMRRMKPRGTGHIVNVASIAGKFGAPGGATYCRLQARRRRPLRVDPRRALRHRRRGPRRDAGVRQHRADRGHERAQGGQAPDARGRRGGRRRRAEVRALRRLRAEVARGPRPLGGAEPAVVRRSGSGARWAASRCSRPTRAPARRTSSARPRARRPPRRSSPRPRPTSRRRPRPPRRRASRRSSRRPAAPDPPAGSAPPRR